MVKRSRSIPIKSEYLNDILGPAASICFDLINDILDLAKIEAGKMDLDLETFSLRKRVTDEVCALMKPLAARRNIAMTIVPAPGTRTRSPWTIESLNRSSTICYPMRSNSATIMAKSK